MSTQKHTHHRYLYQAISVGDIVKHTAVRSLDRGEVIDTSKDGVVVRVRWDDDKEYLHSNSLLVIIRDRNVDNPNDAFVSPLYIKET